MKAHHVIAAVFCLASNVAIAASDGTNWTQLLQEVRRAAATNNAVALNLADRAVTLSGSNSAALMARANVHELRRAYDQAIADVSAVITKSPETAAAWQLRGTLYFKASKFAESVVDFNEVLKLAPQQRPFHWQRGISLYYAGDFVEGRKQFELHESVNPNDVENAVWHYLCVARTESVEKARESLLKPGPDARVPMKELHELFAGRGSVETVLSAAARDREGIFYAHLYLGLYFDAQGNSAKAKEHISTAAKNAPNNYMGDVARVHHRLLTGRR